MKKILIVGLSYNIGGIETSIMNYYRNIDKSKYQIDFISMFDKLAFEDEILKNNSKVHKITNFKLNPIKYKKELKQILLNENYDAIHINMLSAANIIPIKVAKKCNIKNIIVHSHNGGTPKGFIRKLLHKINKNYITSNATTFLACSQLAGEWLFGKNVKFDIINNAIDLDSFKYDKIKRNKIRNELNLRDTDFVIGHVGRFFEQKNHSFLIDIFASISKKNPNAKLLLLGDGELRKSIEEKITLNGLNDKVILTGTVSNVNDYYSAMDSFLLPSLFEGLPMVLIEAQTCGLNCFLSNTITIEAKIIDEFYYFSLNDSPKEIARMILNKGFSSNREFKYEKMVDSKYNIKKECERLLNYYE